MGARMLKALWGLWLLAALLPAQAQEVYYIHTDALGSPVAETDANRNVVTRFEYEPYGRRIGTGNDDKPGFTGHVMDAATGLAYMQQRYYDLGIGAFLSVDPVTAFSNPVGQFHRYRYAANNPYKFIDPDGRQPKEKDNRSICNNKKCGVIEVNSSGKSSNFTEKNFKQRVARATAEVAAVRGQVSEVPHANEDSAAQTFERVFQPISSRYGVEIDGAIEGVTPFYITGVAVGDKGRLIEGTNIYIGYTVEGGFGANTPTLHTHPLVFEGAPGYSPFSPQDLHWYSASRASKHYVSDPSGLYRYDGAGNPPVRIGE